jgi:ribonuclease HI
MVWVPEHMGMDGNEIADELAQQGSSHPLTGPEPALVYLQSLPGGVIRDWTNRKHEEQ